MTLNTQMVAAIVEQLGLDPRGIRCSPIGGGDIARASRIDTGRQTLFVKSLPPEHAGLLSAEAAGLAALDAAAAVRVPRVLGRGETDGEAWLALEYLDLTARSAAVDARLGTQLAALHRHVDERYGWPEDNFIGLTPQPNARSGDWVGFFRDRRLGYQMERLAGRHGQALSPALIDRALRAWEHEADGHQPAAALLHGDLWSGNAAALADGQPVIFDPAVHHGDRECDLAMTELFGGFSQSFYRAYQAAWPLPEGWQRRRRWYRLYHLLNHANLFGGGYLDRVRRELAELGG